MARIVSIGSALQDIFLVDHDVSFVWVLHARDSTRTSWWEKGANDHRYAKASGKGDHWGDSLLVSLAARLQVWTT